ncbi:MAG: lectin-like protein [Schaedlerella sp.]|nr:lectin-like protein [Schaedlerella sp.]
MRYCSNCGGQLKEGTKFCGKCGTKVEYNINAREEKTVKKNGKKGLVIAAIVLLLLTVLFTIFLIRKNQRNVKEYENCISKAERYLEKLDYENAEASYLDAIDIESKQRKPYLELAKIYVYEEDYDKAEEILLKADEAGAEYKEDTAEEVELAQAEEEAIIEKIEEEKGIVFGEETTETTDDNILKDALQWNGHYYAIFETSHSWEDAVKYCESLGGYPAVITSEEENNVVFDYLLECGYDSAYFGLTDNENEGNWNWITGETLKYDNWHEGEPNGENSEEDYAMFFYMFTEGTWNDGDFSNSSTTGKKPVICEWD